MQTFAGRPVLTRAQVRELDRRCLEDYGIPGVVLMENAGAGASRWIVEHFRPARVLVVCGGGNNGGDGYVVARHLSNAGLDVALLATEPVERLRGDAATMARIAQRMQLPIAPFEESHATHADFVVDALLGTGFQGAPREGMARAIEFVNRARTVVSLDLPSGLDADSGIASGPVVRATATLTFAACKPGLLLAGARGVVGDLALIDIGAPHALFDALARGSG